MIIKFLGFLLFLFLFISGFWCLLFLSIITPYWIIIGIIEIYIKKIIKLNKKKYNNNKIIWKK